MHTRVVVMAAAIMASLSAAVGGSGAATVTSRESAVAEVRLAPSVAGGPRGVGLFRQRGARVRGWVVVWGLDPRSKHAVHFHGPRSACGTKADPVAAHADLEANANGVAFATVDLTSRLQILRRGFYYNVHARPSIAGENPEIACGNVVRVR